MSIISKCELCGREVGVPDYDTGPSSEYCVSCKRMRIDELPGVPYFRQHPLEPGLHIMRTDGKETTVKIISSKEIVKIPDIPVPGVDSEWMKKELEAGNNRKIAGIPKEILSDADPLLAVLILIRERIWGNAPILDRGTVHFLNIHIDDIAPLLVERDIKYLQYAGIKVDPEGYLYADRDSAEADKREVRDTEAHARTDGPE